MSPARVSAPLRQGSSGARSSLAWLDRSFALSSVGLSAVEARWMTVFVQSLLAHRASSMPRKLEARLRRERAFQRRRYPCGGTYRAHLPERALPVEAGVRVTERSGTALTQ